MPKAARDLPRHRFIDIHSFSPFHARAYTLIMQIVPASLCLIFSAVAGPCFFAEAVRAENPAPCLSEESVLPSVSHFCNQFMHQARKIFI